jgi:hypothetical protein
MVQMKIGILVFDGWDLVVRISILPSCGIVIVKNDDDGHQEYLQHDKKSQPNEGKGSHTK